MSDTLYANESGSGVGFGVEPPDDNELESWRQAADSLLKHNQPAQCDLRRAAFMLQDAYLFASKLRDASIGAKES